MITNQFRFGPGSTNVLLRDGANLVYTNGATDSKFVVLNGSANGIELEAQGLTGFLTAGGSANALGLRVGAAQIGFTGNIFSPVVDLHESLGSLQSTWANTWTSNLFVRGFTSAITNYSQLESYHTGTNGIIALDSQSGGIAGVPRPIALEFNSTNLFQFDYLGNILFGPGTTNVLYRSGSDLVATNGAGSWDFNVVGGSGTAKFGVLSTLARVQALDGVDLQWTNAGTKTVRFWNNRIHPLQSGIVLGGDLTTSPKIPFSDLNLDGTAYIYGFLDATAVTNYSRLALHHTGTNGSILFDSQSAGTAGRARPFVFSTNGVVSADLQFDNAGFSVFTLHDTAGFSNYLRSAASTLQLVGSSALDLGNNSNQHYLRYGSDIFSPITTSATLGEIGGGWMPWTNFWMTGKQKILGWSDSWTSPSTNYALLSISHGGTNTGAIYDNQSAGSAGVPLNHSFQLGSTNQFNIGDGWIQLAHGLTKAQKATITATNGMIVYQTDNTPGLRAYVNGAWVMISTVADP